MNWDFVELHGGAGIDIASGAEGRFFVVRATVACNAAKFLYEERLEHFDARDFFAVRRRLQRFTEDVHAWQRQYTCA